MHVLTVLSLALWPSLFAATHNPLLPKPRQIRYGTAQLRVPGLGIRLATGAADADRFAAATLGVCLSERSGSPLDVSEGYGAGRLITLKRTGAEAPLPVVDEKPGPEARESYRLKIDGQGAELTAPSSAGLYYGVQTLCQLAEGQGESAVLPEAEIHDWPALAYRGVMVDLSHAQLHTEEEINRQIDYLARWKANQYYFYNEASIELDGYSIINPQGRYTKEQVRRIIDYARQRHIDVVPCLELYGHLHDLFRLERYSDLAAFPHGGEFDPLSPKVMDLLTDWIDQFARLFPSPFVHIGFDETWQIEQAAKKQGAGATPAKLFVEQVKNVARLFDQRGKRSMAWADIAIKYPDTLPQLPAGFIGVAWEYDPNYDYGKWLGPLGARNVPTIIATGTSNWREVAPDLDYTFGNIDNFLAAAKKANVLGIIHTLWSDSAMQIQRMAYPTLAYAAAASWQSAPVERGKFLPEYAALLYPQAAAPDVAAAFDTLNRAEIELQKAMSQETMWEMWEDPFFEPNLQRSAQNAEHLRQARLLAEDAEEHVYRALGVKADPSLLNSLVVGARMVDFAAMKFQYALEIAERWKKLSSGPVPEDLWNQLESDVIYQSHGRFADLMDASTELKKLFRKAWLEESTDFRLESALGRFDGEYEFWRRLQVRMRTTIQKRKDKAGLPPLDQVLHGRQ